MESDSVRVGTDRADVVASDMGNSLNGCCSDSSSKWGVTRGRRVPGEVDSRQSKVEGGSKSGSGALRPLFFVSVASKGLSPTASLLFSTLAGRPISVATKGITVADCWREGNWTGWKAF